MNRQSPRSEPDSTESTSEAGCEQTRESDQAHVDADASELGSPFDVLVTYVTPTQGEPSDGLLVEPTQGERLDGVVGHFSQIKDSKDGGTVIEFGEVHEQSENQDAEQEDLPFVPNSFANLDLPRLTVWGWILLLGSPFAIIIPLMGVGHLLGVEQLPNLLHEHATMLFLALWGALFVGGRIFLESRNVPVVRRKKVG